MVSNIAPGTCVW